MLATDFHIMDIKNLYGILKKNIRLENLLISNMPYLFLNFVKICGFL